MNAINNRARGLVHVSADTSNVNALLAELQKSFEAFKAENDAHLKDKFKDVVREEKIERINSSLAAFQSEMDKVNLKLASATISGGDRIRDPDYSKAFEAHIRKGEINASLNKGTAAEGGYTTPTEWDRTIMDELKLVSPVRQLFTVKAVGVAAASKLVNKHGAASGWVGETAARPETAAPQLGTLPIGWGEIYANPSATQQILDDSLIDIESWLSGEVLLEFAYQEGVAVISGNGTNKPNGILTYVTGAANAAAHPSGAILLTNSGNAGLLTAQGVVDLVYALPSAFTGNAKFSMNRKTHGVVRSFKDGQNNYLWQPSYAAGQPATLLGYPLVEVPDMPDVAANAIPILFGDHQRAYEIYDRLGVRVLRDPYTAKPYVLFYTTKRVGGACVNPQAINGQKVSA